MFSNADAPARAQGGDAVLAGVACYLIWGILPLFFQGVSTSGASSGEIVAHRAAWTIACASLVVWSCKGWPEVKAALRNKRIVAWLALGACLMAINMAVYVLAVDSGRTLEASFAYYLSPLFNVVVGAALFGERQSRLAKAAVGLALCGVLLQAVAIGQVPWMSLIMAVSFCGYGAVRKYVEVSVPTGLFVEATLLGVLGIPAVVWLQSTGQGHLFVSASACVWLLTVAPVTLAPTLMFVWAARRLAYSTLGFLQFIAPTLVFAVGVLQGEHFTWLRGVSFGLIWLGALIFGINAVRGGGSAAVRYMDVARTREAESANALLDCDGVDRP